MFRVRIRQTSPRIVGESRRSVADQSNRRDDERGLAFELWVTEPFGHPDAARIGRVDELKSNPPTSVAAFHNVNPPCVIAAVGVIVASEEIPILIEGKFLRIAEPAGEDLEI